jgi:hypothetical protein
MDVRLISDAGVERRPIDQLGRCWRATTDSYGMNVIVNDRTRPVHLAVVLVVMAAMSATLLRWARRQGWW